MSQRGVAKFLELLFFAWCYMVESGTVGKGSSRLSERSSCCRYGSRIALAEPVPAARQGGPVRTVLVSVLQGESDSEAGCPYMTWG